MWSTLIQVGVNAAASGGATAAGAYAVKRAGLAEPNPVAVALGTAGVVLGVSLGARHLSKSTKNEGTK